MEHGWAKRFSLLCSGVSGLAVGCGQAFQNAYFFLCGFSSSFVLSLLIAHVGDFQGSVILGWWNIFFSVICWLRGFVSDTPSLSGT